MVLFKCVKKDTDNHKGRNGIGSIYLTHDQLKRFLAL